MATGFDGEGQYFMKATPARKGDFLEFFAEVDLLGALSACPGGGRCPLLDGRRGEHTCVGLDGVEERNILGIVEIAHHTHAQRTQHNTKHTHSSLTGGDCGASHSDDATQCYPLRVDVLRPRRGLENWAGPPPVSGYSTRHGLRMPPPA